MKIYIIYINGNTKGMYNYECNHKDGPELRKEIIAHQYAYAYRLKENNLVITTDKKLYDGILKFKTLMTDVNSSILTDDSYDIITLLIEKHNTSNPTATSDLIIKILADDIHDDVDFKYKTKNYDTVRTQDIH